jgi:hypothetical protein
MGEICQQTAYYVNGKLPCLALIARGVPFPPGRWIWLASEMISPDHAEELARDLFPALERARIRFATLLTAHDVDELQREVSRAVVRHGRNASAALDRPPARSQRRRK